MHVGRRLAEGRFEITEWIGPEPHHGIAIGRDTGNGELVRLTFVVDISRSPDELRPQLTRELPGVAPVRYLGPTAAHDGWLRDAVMMAERLPPGEALSREKPSLGVELVRHVARVHRSGTALATVRPESTFVTASGDIELVARGERLWMMPRPNYMKGTIIPPWAPGYLAPEYFMAPLVEDPAPPADVFSLGVMIATSLLGQFPYDCQYLTQCLVDQMRGVHVPLPSTPLGDVVARCLRPDPAARPGLDELEQAFLELG